MENTLSFLHIKFEIILKILYNEWNCIIVEVYKKSNHYRKIQEIGEADMTTIIVIVVVALVFFVTVCVVTLMIWKRETEMRTDSLRAIEQNLQEMLNEMNDGRQSKSWTGRHEDEAEGTAGKIVEVSRAGSRDKTVRRKSADPFAWVKAQGTGDKNLKTEKEKETAEDKIHKILRWTTVMNDKACEEPDESTQSDKGKFVLAEEKEIFPAEEEKIALHEEDAVHIEEAAAVT